MYITGTKLVHRNTLDLNTLDWQLLAEAMAPGHKLLKATDALLHGPHMLPFETCPHKIGDLVMVPGNPPANRQNQHHLPHSHMHHHRARSPHPYT